MPRILVHTMPAEGFWVTLGREVMREARQRRGLSYESVARVIPVSAKTWSRWEARGAVPRAHVQLVADALGLGIEYVSEGNAVTTVRLDVASADVLERLSALEARLARAEKSLRLSVASGEEIARIVQRVLSELQSSQDVR